MKNRYLSPVLMMLKADRACLSARILFDVGDIDGASNRAYYAMFDAATAALLSSDAPIDRENLAKTHGGLISAFGKYLVKEDKVQKKLGRILIDAFEVRQMADYNGSSVELVDAQKIVEDAEAFVSEMHEFIAAQKVLPHDSAFREPG